MKIPKTKKIKKCRLCGNKKLRQIYNFGNHFVSNFVSKNLISRGIRAPLNLVYCNNWSTSSIGAFSASRNNV